MFHRWLSAEDWTWMTETLGLTVDRNGAPKTVAPSRSYRGRASIEVHSIRTAMKRGALGWPEQHLVVVLSQWRAGYFDPDRQKLMDAGKTTGASRARTTGISNIAPAARC